MRLIINSQNIQNNVLYIYTSESASYENVATQIDAKRADCDETKQSKTLGAPALRHKPPAEDTTLAGSAAVLCLF